MHGAKFFCTETLIKAALTEVQRKWKKMVLSFRLTVTLCLLCEKQRMNKSLLSHEEILDAE